MEQRLHIPFVSSSRDVALAKDGTLYNCYVESSDDGKKRIKKRPGFTTYLDVANATVTNSSVVTATVAAGGAGYAVGDVITLDSGTGDRAKAQVLTVAAGAVATLKVVYGGNGYSNSGYNWTTTAVTGAGAGCTISAATFATASGTTCYGMFGADSTNDTPTYVQMGNALYYFNSAGGWICDAVIAYNVAIGQQVDYDFFTSDSLSIGAMAIGSNIYYTKSGFATPTLHTGPAYTSPKSATCRGIVSMDGYFFVGNGTAINHCALLDPTSWPALNTIQVKHRSVIQFVGKLKNYIVAMCRDGIEFFYNAGNATGSVLSNVENMAITNIGCDDGNSVTKYHDSYIFISKTHDEQRRVTMLTLGGLQEISTIWVNALLQTMRINDGLSSYEALRTFARIIYSNGCAFYVLNFENTAGTQYCLAYNLKSNEWANWTQLTAGSTQGITSASVDASNIVTFTKAAHGFTDGAVVTMSSGNPAAYDGSFPIFGVTANTYQAQYQSNPGTFVSGKANTYTEGVYSLIFQTGIELLTAAAASRKQLVAHKTNGIIYEILDTTYTDNSVPIKVSLRTINMDGGTSYAKFMHRLRLVADKLASSILCRYSDDDYQTYSSYRKINLNSVTPQLHKLGRFFRRGFQFIHAENTDLRLESIDVEVERGTR